MISHRPATTAASTVYELTAPTAPSGTPLAGDSTADVVIIGGGITGLSAALHAARTGLRVALVEARQIGWGASGRNGGQVNPGLKHEPARIEADFGQERAARMIALGATAPERLFALVREHAITCEAAQTGTIRAAFTSSSARFIDEATAELARRGWPVRLLDAPAMAEATGSERYVAGGLNRSGGSVNPLAYARGLARVAERFGARIHTGTPVAALTRTGAGWKVAAPGGAILAPRVIVATNGYTDDLWPGLRQTVVPVYSGIIASKPLAPRDLARILPARPVLYEHETLTVYYRIDEAGRLLIGGRSLQQPLDGPRHFPDLRAYSQRLWPFLPKIEWSHGWNGQVAITTDHYPNLTELAPGLVACIGYNGRGVAMATAMGRELARWTVGEPLDALDLPATRLKPFPFHRFWPLGACLRLAYGRLRYALAV